MDEQSFDQEELHSAQSSDRHLTAACAKKFRRNELFSIVQFSGIADGKGGVDSLCNPTQNVEVAAMAGS